MTALRLPSICALAAAFTVVSAHAAVTAVSSATFSGTTSQVRTLESVTIGTTTYSQLEGAVSVTLTRDTNDMRYWIETDPGSNTAAVTGLTGSAGILNTLASFQFGRTLTAADTLFFMDLENDDEGDTIEIRLINAAGQDVGTANIAIDGTQFGSRLYNASYQTNSAAGALTTAGTYGPLGVSFGVSDFSGDVSTATGFRIIQSDGVSVDPVIAGIAVIPEPGSAALAAGALVLGLLRRRRK